MTPENELSLSEGFVGRAVTVLTVAIAGGLIVLVGVRWYAYQWDFHMFYGAAVDFAAGRSPYRGYGLSFYHPPITLYVYRLFTFLPEPVACTVWYVLKIAALYGLMRVWHNDFVRLQWRAATVLFFILAYGAALYADLVAGNISIFEELLLWYGFSRLLRGRYLVFCLCVVLAAQVKLTPVFFAVLLLVACDRPQWRWFFATIAGFAAVFSLNFVLQPALTRTFFAVSSQLDERGTDCTSVLAFIRDVSDLALGTAFTKASRLDELLFVAIAGAIGLISLWRLIEYRRREARFDPRLVISFACFVFALISPRFKVYTYIILLVPTLYLFRAVAWRHMVPLAVAAMAVPVLFPQAWSLLPIRLAFGLVNVYLPLFAAAFIWIAFLDVLGWPQSLGRPVRVADNEGV